MQQFSLFLFPPSTKQGYRIQNNPCLQRPWCEYLMRTIRKRPGMMGLSFITNIWSVCCQLPFVLFYSCGTTVDVFKQRELPPWFVHHAKWTGGPQANRTQTTLPLHLPLHIFITQMEERIYDLPCVLTPRITNALHSNLMHILRKWTLAFVRIFVK